MLSGAEVVRSALVRTESPLFPAVTALALIPNCTIPTSGNNNVKYVARQYTWTGTPLVLIILIANPAGQQLFLRFGCTIISITLSGRDTPVHCSLHKVMHWLRSKPPSTAPENTGTALLQ